MSTRLETRMLFFVALSAATVRGALAQSQDSAPLLKVALGTTRDYVAKSTNTYYNFAVMGHTLGSSGTEPSFTDFSAGGLADQTTKPFFFGLQRGTPSIGGSLLQGFSTTSLSQSVFAKALGSEFKDFNIVFGADAQLETLSSTTYSYGAEYKPVGFLSWLRDAHNLPIFSGFGIVGFSGYHAVPSATSPADFAAPTLRLMIGKSFYRDASAEEEKRADAALSDNWTKFDTVQKVQDQYTNIAKLTGYDAILARILHSILMEWKGGALHGVPAYTDSSSADWKATVDHTRLNLPPPANPTIAFWVDGNARYALTNNAPGGKWRSIWSANAKFFFDPNKSTGYVQVQYLNGFTEANATKRSNMLVAMFGFQL